MRYEVARKVYEAFEGLHPGLTVEVTRNAHDCGLRVTARKITYATVSLTDEEVRNLAANDSGETALCALLMKAAETAVAMVLPSEGQANGS